MTILNRKKDQNIEYVVIGAGLSGLLTAAGLKHKGHDVLVIDGADFAGGTSRGVYSPIGLVDNGLKMFASDADDLLNQSHLAFLSKILNLNLKFEKIENAPITFVHGDMKPFVGFGSHAPDFHKPLSYFFAPERIKILADGKEIKLHEIISHLIQFLGDAFQSRMQVTQIIHDGHGVVTQLMINGTKLLSVDNVIFSAHPKFFNVLFPANSLIPKIKQKLSKGTYWTAVCIDFFHKGTVSTRAELHMLTGTTQDEIGPCVGLFHPEAANSDGELVQQSQWLTYIEYDSSEDAEAVGAILKKIKRQIKRAYPLALDQLVSERIAVLPCREAEVDITLTEKGLLPSYSNLWIASGSWTEKCNIWGCVEQVQKVLHNFDFNIDEAGTIQNENSSNESQEH